MELLNAPLNVVISLAVLVFGSLVVGFALFGVRKAVLRWRARSPRIQIAPFGWTGVADAEKEAAWVTALFRDQLRSLRLDGIEALPDHAAGSPLVEIVEGVSQGVAPGVDFGRAMSRVWRAVFPAASYEVSAILRPAGRPGRGRIAVQLTSRTRGETLVSVVTPAGRWGGRAREAATAVAGALYPYVAARHKKPWTHWDTAVPGDLMDLYQRGLAYEQDDRLEQALLAFHDALRKDPLNPNLRLKMAMLQERLGLHLSAWFTYRAILDERDRALWRGPDRRVRLLALYRLAVLFCDPRVATQWVAADDGGGDAHAEELTELREMLLDQMQWEGARDPSLIGADGRAADGKAAVVGGSSGRVMSELVATLGVRDALEPFEGKCRRRVERIRRILQVHGLGLIEELGARQRLLPRKGLGNRLPWRHPEVPPLAVEVSERLVRIRIAFSAGDEWVSGGVPAYRRLIDTSSLTREHLGPRARMRRWLADRRDDSWLLHYNSACAISAGLEAPDVKDSEKRGIARRAVRELDRYAHQAGSALILAQADWVLREDPDLAVLRGDRDSDSDREFRHWAIRHFGDRLPEPSPDAEYEAWCRLAVMLRRWARASEIAWLRRVEATDAVRAETLVSWWQGEVEHWREVVTACREHRSWRQRAHAFEAMESWSEASEHASVDFAEPLSPGEVSKASDRVALLKRFQGLSGAISGTGGEPDADQSGLPLVWVEQQRKSVESGTTHGAGAARIRSTRPLSPGECVTAVEASERWGWLAGTLEPHDATISLAR